MRKKPIISILVLFVYVLLISPMASALSPEQLKNASYKGIYDEPVQLGDGYYEGKPFVEGGASRPTVTFINELSASGDLNGDGIDDAAVILVESSGGSGSFRYLAAVLSQNAQAVNEATLLLGDRVSIKSIAIQGGRILVEFIEQREKIRNTYHIQDNILVESGSENLGALSLSDLEGPTWVLTALSPGQDLVPETEMTAIFGDGTISGSSGCNSYSAGVTVQGQGTLSIGPAMGTMMACAEAVMEQEGDFMAKLAAVSQFSFSGGQLLLTHETGALLFAPRQDDALVEGGSEDLGALSVSDLEGPTWVLAALSPGQELVPETEITVVFADAKVSGSSGCNNYFAEVTDQGQGTLSIGPAMGTMMACAEPVMQQEGDFMAKLAAVTQFSLSEGRLELKYEGGVLLFAPRSSSSGQPEALAVKEDLEAMTIYPIGWSEDGQFAYVAERPVQSCTQCYFFALYIQDLVSDEIVWEFSYGGENPEFSDFQSVWVQHAPLFEEHLTQYHIVWNTEAAMLEEFPLVTQDDEVTLSVENTFVPDDVEVPYGSGRLQQAEIVMTSKAKGQKSLHHEEFGDYKPVDLVVRGALSSPFEGRLAVLLAEERLGAEIQPHIIHYRFIGASLTAGFGK